MSELEPRKWLDGDVVKETATYKRLICSDCHLPFLVYYKRSGIRECQNGNCPSKYNLSRDITKKFTRSEFEE
jgi:hypothetical protein